MESEDKEIWDGHGVDGLISEAGIADFRCLKLIFHHS
jgi:hypothetical protein